MLSIEEKVAPSSNLSNDTYFLYVPFLVLKLSCKEKKVVGYSSQVDHQK